MRGLTKLVVASCGVAGAIGGAVMMSGHVGDQQLQSDGMYLTVAHYRADPDAAGPSDPQSASQASYSMDSNFVDPALVGEPNQAPAHDDQHVS